MNGFGPGKFSRDYRELNASNTELTLYIPICILSIPCFKIAHSHLVR